MNEWHYVERLVCLTKVQMECVFLYIFFYEQPKVWPFFYSRVLACGCRLKLLGGAGELFKYTDAWIPPRSIELQSWARGPGISIFLIPPRVAARMENFYSGLSGYIAVLY